MDRFYGTVHRPWKTRNFNQLPSNQNLEPSADIWSSTAPLSPSATSFHPQPRAVGIDSSRAHPFPHPGIPAPWRADTVSNWTPPQPHSVIPAPHPPPLQSTHQIPPNPFLTILLNSNPEYYDINFVHNCIRQGYLPPDLLGPQTTPSGVLLLELHLKRLQEHYQYLQAVYAGYKWRTPEERRLLDDKMTSCEVNIGRAGEWLVQSVGGGEPGRALGGYGTRGDGGEQGGFESSGLGARGNTGWNGHEDENQREYITTNYGAPGEQFDPTSMGIARNVGWPGHSNHFQRGYSTRHQREEEERHGSIGFVARQNNGMRGHSEERGYRPRNHGAQQFASPGLGGRGEPAWHSYSDALQRGDGTIEHGVDEEELGSTGLGTRGNSGWDNSEEAFENVQRVMDDNRSERRELVDSGEQHPELAYNTAAEEQFPDVGYNQPEEEDSGIGDNQSEDDLSEVAPNQVEEDDLSLFVDMASQDSLRSDLTEGLEDLSLYDAEPEGYEGYNEAMERSPTTLSVISEEAELASDEASPETGMLVPYETGLVDMELNESMTEFCLSGI